MNSSCLFFDWSCIPWLDSSYRLQENKEGERLSQDWEFSDWRQSPSQSQKKLKITSWTIEKRMLTVDLPGSRGEKQKAVNPTSNPCWKIRYTKRLQRTRRWRLVRRGPYSSCYLQCRRLDVAWSNVKLEQRCRERLLLELFHWEAVPWRRGKWTLS